MSFVLEFSDYTYYYVVCLCRGTVKMANAIDAKQKLDLKFGTFEKSPYICTEYIENVMEYGARPQQAHGASAPHVLLKKDGELFGGIIFSLYICRRIFTINHLDHYGNNKKKKNTRRGQSCR